MLRRIGLRCIIISVPIGAIGVASKEYIPSIASNAERLGFNVHGHIMLRVMSACSNILHQFAILNEGGVPALIAVKWFLNILHARLAMFVRCMSAGVYCTAACCSAMNVSTSRDVSLSSLCNCGR